MNLYNKIGRFFECIKISRKIKREERCVIQIVEELTIMILKDEYVLLLIYVKMLIIYLMTEEILFCHFQLVQICAQFRKGNVLYLITLWSENQMYIGSLNFHNMNIRTLILTNIHFSAILSLYFKNKLHFSEDTSTVIYHTFSLFCYFCPLFGAMLADQLLGKFK